MAINKNEIREIVERRLGLTPIEHTGLIDLYIDEIERRILNYINATSVPEGLKFTWAAMVASTLSSEQLAVLFPSTEEDEAYETTIGDTTVKPVKSVVAPNRPTIATVDRVVFDYRSELNAYRRLRW